ncbi:hypothetical protein FACS1894151_02570 [Spirochaetia bacterium]|nr:hypothetical protein FACS1894151_02570 [Spirochaetia bacterium]
MIRNLTEDECRYAVKNSDFSEDLVKGKASVIILTQSWCPQWIAVKSYLAEAEKKAAEKTGTDINIYTIEYDIAEWRQLEHEDFMSFKENIFQNYEIPYIRYYRDGIFSGDSNYVSQDEFFRHIFP